MSQSLSKMWTHLIFSTKDRYPLLSDRGVREQLHAYLATILRKQTAQPFWSVAWPIMFMHFLLSKNHSIAQIVYEVKRSSSKWIKTQGPEYKKFYWQNGYGAFSVSQSHVGQVQRYILRQEQHHRNVTFQDEYREFLQRYKVEYDERYIWD